MSTIPFPRTLLGPGPSSVSPRALAAMDRAPIGYLDPELFELLDAMRANLRTVFGTANGFTIPLTGTGMAGMQCCFANLLEPGDTVVIGVCGVFGERMVEIARRLGADVVRVDGEWGGSIDPARFKQALGATSGVKLVATVHAETSTGVLQPLKEIADLAHGHGALFLADCVTSLGGLPVDLDANGVDVAYSASQKCMGAPSGLSPISVNEAAYAVATGRKTPVADWYHDWKLHRDYFDAPHNYHHTVPVNLYYALGESLNEIAEEGLPARFERHANVSDDLVSRLSDLGVCLFPEPSSRLTVLSAVRVPAGVSDEADVRRRLLMERGIEIGGGLGALKGKIWRIGTMGYSASHADVGRLVDALSAILKG